MCCNKFSFFVFYTSLVRYGWMQELRSFSHMPSAWAASQLWEVTTSITTTATSKVSENIMIFLLLLNE